MDAKLWLFLLSASAMNFSFAEESPNIPYQDGATLLSKVALGDTESIAPAMRAFCSAASQFEKTGNTSAVQTVNANLYWLRKQLSAEQFIAFAANPDNVPAVTKIREVYRPIDVEEAKKYLDRAAAFAQEHLNEPLLVAIRYFEVADRFMVTPQGIEAQKRCNEAMRKIKIPLETAEIDYKRAMASANENYENAKKSAAENLSSSLISAQSDATRRGDLDTALKLRERLKRLTITKLKTADEVREWLGGTAWEITSEKGDPNGSYVLLFNKNGTFKRSDRNNTWEWKIMGPKTFKLYNYDNGAFNDDLSEFWAFGAGGQYHGVLKQ